jgi:uncharacterized integral membrane protein
MSAFTKRLVRVSAVIQFMSSKASLLFSTVTMSTVLSIKFHWPLPLVLIGILILGILGMIFVVKSGWYRAEMEYVGDRMLKKP